MINFGFIKNEIAEIEYAAKEIEECIDPYDFLFGARSALDTLMEHVSLIKEEILDD